MKRKGNLYEKIYDLDNLYLAYYKARKGKTDKKDIVAFSRNYDENLRKIRQQIQAETFTFGNYHFFKVYDPKERVICASAFEERIVQHAVMNICGCDFERYQLPNSYACRIGKGTFSAIDQIAYYAKKYPWFVKLDVRKYFDNIRHEVLKMQLRRMYKDEKLLALFGKIIDSYSVGVQNFEPLRQCGLPIGNLTSQYFANHYLSYADRFVVNDLQITGYVRYMDDMFLFGKDKIGLMQKTKLFEIFLTEKLCLTFKPVVLNKIAHGVSALGFVIYSNKIFLNQRTKKRFAQKTGYFQRQLLTQQITETEYLQHYNALFGFICHADSKGFVQKADTPGLWRSLCRLTIIC
jgi:retron-type reverse transcriptase